MMSFTKVSAQECSPIKSNLPAALQHQEAILKEMHAVQQRDNTVMNPEDDVGKAVLHSLQLANRCAVLIDVPDALQ